MIADPISFFALGISILSLVLTVNREMVDRQHQCEQLRGEIIARLTARGVQLLSMIRDLMGAGGTCEEPGAIKCTCVHSMSDLLGRMTEVRERLRRLPTPRFGFASSTLLTLRRIRSDLDDAEAVFDDLQENMTAGNWEGAIRCSGALAQRYS